MKRIVVIGGGTGTFTVLSGLKKHPVELEAIVSMADDGGSTGILRDELGVLPPGDVRQCLVALSHSDGLMRELMNYRFENGGLRGHNFGNIFLSSLEKTTGSFEKAIAKASEILRLRGTVIPVTLKNTRLVAVVTNGKIIQGEDMVGKSDLRKLKKIYLSPKARANVRALRAIKNANLIVIGPGDFYRSLIPNLLVSGIREAIAESSAKKIYVCNLVTHTNHTDGWRVKKFAVEIEKFLGSKIDYVLYNTHLPTKKQLVRYARKGEAPVHNEKGLPKKFIGSPLLRTKFGVQKKSDPITRTLIRHDSDKLASVIMNLL